MGLWHWQILQTHLEAGQAPDCPASSVHIRNPRLQLLLHQYRDTHSSRGWEQAVPPDGWIWGSKNGEESVVVVERVCYCTELLLLLLISSVLVGKMGTTALHQTLYFPAAITSFLCSKHYLPFQFCQRRTVWCDAFSAQQCRLFLVCNLLPN